MKTAFRSSVTAAAAAAMVVLAFGATPACAAGKPATAAERTFMMKAAGSGLYEVEVSKLAADKAESADVKKYAAMLVADHTKANAELMALADARGVKLPTQPPSNKLQVITRLSTMSGAAFDQAYIKQVGIADHRADIALFEKGSKGARDAEVKSWAGDKLPTLREHFAAAQQMNVADPATRPVTGAERMPMNSAPTKAKPDMHHMTPDAK